MVSVPARSGRAARASSALPGLAHRLARGAMGVALRLLPSRRQVVVYGWREEANALEVLRQLVQCYPGTVYWFVDGAPSAATQDLLAGAEPAPLVVPRRSWPAVKAYLLAELVFHTHGLFTSPDPGARKVHVNLWHGDGPKRVDHVDPGRAGTCSYLVSGTTLFGREKAAYFRVDDPRLLVVGNPRIDQFDRPADDAALLRLGLDPGRPLVLWMPTFRTATVAGQHLWSDADRLVAGELQREFSPVLAAARETGLQFVVKPHPLDADAFERLGVSVLRDADLAAAGCALYPLLARAAALVTDYSSVWTDYLALDRPVVLFCPDLERYEAGRAFTVPSLYDVAPGPVARTSDALATVLRSISAGRDDHVAQRRAAAARIGAVVETGATQRLFRALAEARRSRLVLKAPRAEASSA